MLADFNNFFAVRSRNYFCCNLIAVTYYLPVCYLMTLVWRHCAPETLQLLRWETPDFISPDLWPPNSPDLNPVDYEIWAVTCVVFTRRKFIPSTNWSSGWLKSGATLNSRLLIWLLSSGVENLELVCLLKEGTSNIAFELTDILCVDFVTIYHFCVTVLCFV